MGSPFRPDPALGGFTADDVRQANEIVQRQRKAEQAEAERVAAARAAAEAQFATYANSYVDYVITNIEGWVAQGGRVTKEARKCTAYSPDGVLAYTLVRARWSMRRELQFWMLTATQPVQFTAPGRVAARWVDPAKGGVFDRPAPGFPLQRVLNVMKRHATAP